MEKPNSIQELYGNTALRYLIAQLLNESKFPQISLLSGPMGVGKSTTAHIIANTITRNDKSNVQFFNFGSPQNFQEIEQAYFKNAPLNPIVLIFDEFHYLGYEYQRIFPAMLDGIPKNVYVVMTTTEKRKILKPIVSRAQTFEFRYLNHDEMQRLLNDYTTKTYKQNCSQEVQNILIRKANGTPRDLLNLADLVFSADIDDSKIAEIFGSVQDNIIMFMFSTLKTNSIDFYRAISDIANNIDNLKIREIKDFWARFLLCRLNDNDSSLDQIYTSQLSTLYSDSEIIKITKTLMETNEDKFLLDMLQLNMVLTNASKSAVIGQQIVAREQKIQQTPVVSKPKKTAVDRKALSSLNLQ